MTDFTPTGDLIGDIAKILGDDKGILKAAVEDHRLIDHLDFPVCEAITTGEACANEAAFKGECKGDNCIAGFGLICTDCLMRARRQVSWTCKVCGLHGSFDDLNTLTPIGGAA